MNQKLHYLSKTTISFMILIILLMSSGVTVSADFSEEFSDNSLDDWITYANNHNQGFYTEPSWIIEDGQLVSNGTIGSQNTINYACHQTDFNTKFAFWQYDIWGNDARWRFSFRVTKLPEIRTEGEFAGNYSINPAHFQLVVAAGIGPNGEIANPEIGASHYQWNDTVKMGFRGIGNIDPQDDQLRGWHTYRIERRDLDLMIYEDGVSLINTTLVTSAVDTYNGICMWTELGSGVKVDNITAGPIQDQSGIFSNPFFVGGIIAVAVIGLGYPSFRYFKKKP